MSGLQISTRQFDRMISLGVDCRVRYQISLNYFRRVVPEWNTLDFQLNLYSHQKITQPNGAYLFDWLITPMAALIKTAENSFEGIFDYEQLEVKSPSIAVHRSLGIMFVHNFHDLDPSVPLDRALFQEQANKIEYLVKKQTEAYSSDSRTLYVQVGGAAEECQQFADILRSKYGARDPHILNVTHAEKPRGELESSRNVTLYEMDLRNEKPEASRWEGDDNFWQALLDQINLAPRVP